MNINVIIAEKHAIAMPHEPLVCGNSDYVIEFEFDEEWDKHPTKTARFIFDDRSYIDVVFNGTLCPVPVLKNTHEVLVGVFAGDLKTTTPAYLRSQLSVLCYGGEKTEVSQDLYDQIMQYVNDAEYRVKLDAQNAAQSAENAQASAARASDTVAAVKQYSDNADAKAQEASASASVASESAISAKTSASSAELSASNAMASAGQAAERAQTASEKAVEAEVSAQNAAQAAQAAQEIGKNVDVGNGGLYLVTVENNKVDRAPEEIISAAESGKTILFVWRSRVFSYYGVVTNSNGEEVPAFVAPAKYKSGGILMCDTIEVHHDGSFSMFSSTVSAPNPYKLTIGGQTYNGREPVSVDIPDIYIVTVTWDETGGVWVSDRTQEEITEASAAGKACILLEPLIGHVMPLVGFRDGAPQFVLMEDDNSLGLLEHRAIINTDKTVDICGKEVKAYPPFADLTETGYLRWNGDAWEAASIDQLKAVNPHALNITIDGKTISYDGYYRRDITIPIVKLTVDADGNATI